MEQSERINRYLALQLGLSRREADEFIERGRVKINDTPAQLGGRTAPGDHVTLDDKPITSGVAFIYLAFHKPIGYVCSRRQQGDAPTIYELLPQKYHTLKPVGRLDKNSSGIILLTNDGSFAHQMTHPSFHKTKIYEVKLDAPLQPLHQQMISDFGVMLEDGKSQFLIEKLEEPLDTSLSGISAARDSSGGGTTRDESRSEAVPANDGSEVASTYRVTMSEGRNRQIRRTFAALGYTVTALHRTTFGAYNLGNLKSGEYAELQIAVASSRPSTE